MTITLKNPSRQPACYELTLDCVCDGLPAVPTIRMKTVYSESYPHKASSIAETVKAPPTITLSGREVRKGLPDAVAKAPEIVAAVAAGQLIVIQEAPQATDHVYKRQEGTEVASEAGSGGEGMPPAPKAGKAASKPR